ncbi:Flp1 family type IVb pilin [Saccharibacillus sp. CPCC 101409]|uniref:Flp1 family type IVb pilin n=1 Tax=Saccharibacillus sp. CPCC 101409 TaxID=3058041 RepID=UPI002671B70F|nr:Flp1 family type IVb pilin [Saccharibacillus sp. CPCC 101409]MDO3408634.1 Flp1 family type IVb pilin [Saccharibacillus sp. CPCC 101409]
MLQTIGSKLKNVWKEEDGLGTLEIILIIAVTVIIALIFKNQIADLIDRLFGKLDTQTDNFFKEVDPSKA